MPNVRSGRHDSNEFSVYRREQTSRFVGATLLHIDEEPVRNPEGRGNPSERRQAALFRQATVRSETVDTNTLLIIILVLLVLGGGGFFFRRRV